MFGDCHKLDIKEVKITSLNYIICTTDQSRNILWFPKITDNPPKYDFLVTILNVSISNQWEKRIVDIVMSKR